MKIEKRNLLRPVDLHPEGEVFTVREFRESESGFFKYDLVLISKDKREWVIGLQKQSFNLNQLIDLLGDDTDKFKGKMLRVIPSKWNDQDVLRFMPAK